MPEKFTEVFQEMGKPYRCVIKEIKRDVESKFGQSNVVTVEHDGSDYEWWVKEATFERLFNGDEVIHEQCTVDITLNAPKGKTKFPFYTMEKVGNENTKLLDEKEAIPKEEKKPEVKAAVQPVSSEPQKAYLDDRESKEDRKDRRISMQGFIQALLQRGVPIDEAKSEGLALAKWTREHAGIWQESDLEGAELVNRIFNS